VRESELDLAKQIIASLAAVRARRAPERIPRKPQEMLEAKLDGREIEVPEPEVEAPVVDLMDALRASVAASKKPAAEKKTAAKAPARKRARRRPQVAP
jgi:non-homologous end joining protein Ku